MKVLEGATDLSEVASVITSVERLLVKAQVGCRSKTGVFFSTSRFSKLLHLHLGVWIRSCEVCPNNG